MANKHGVFITEEATAVTVPKETSAGVQVVIGTAPINQVDDPSKVVNVPILANSAAEAMKALGFSDDFDSYTLCQTMYATGNLYQVSPVVYINVLDPDTHGGSSPGSSKDRRRSEEELRGKGTRSKRGRRSYNLNSWHRLQPLLR